MNKILYFDYILELKKPLEPVCSKKQQKKCLISFLLGTFFFCNEENWISDHSQPFRVGTIHILRQQKDWVGG